MACDCNKIDEECDYREGCKVDSKIKRIKSSELKPIEEITAPYREQIKQLTEERDALKAALIEIKEWTVRWVQPGHPIVTFADKALTNIKER